MMNIAFQMDPNTRVLQQRPACITGKTIINSSTPRPSVQICQTITARTIRPTLT